MALRRDPKGKEKNDYGKNDEYKNREKHIYKENRTDGLILSILVDTFISKISLPMQPVPKIGSISVA